MKSGFLLFFLDVAPHGFRCAGTFLEEDCTRNAYVRTVFFFTYFVDIRMSLKEGKSVHGVQNNMFKCIRCKRVPVIRIHSHTHIHTYTYTPYIYTIDWSTRKVFRPLVYFRTTAFIGRKSGRYSVMTIERIESYEKRYIVMRIRRLNVIYWYVYRDVYKKMFIGS